MTTPVVLQFFVPGRPKTKGSLTARARRCHCCDACQGYEGQPQLRDTVASARWRKLMAYQATQAMRAQPHAWPMLGPVWLHVIFILPVDDPIMTGAGDVDKLLRNLMDALQDAQVYRDDVQVVKVDVVKQAPPLTDRGSGVAVLVRSYET